METWKKIAIGTVTVGAVVWGLHYIIQKKNNLSSTGPSGSPPPSLTKPPSGSTTGNQVYTSQPNATIRTSPHLNNGFLGYFGNSIVSIDQAGVWTGTYTGSNVPDTDGTINPATGAPYKWYAVTLSPFYSVLGSSPAYMREDYITIK